MIDLTDKFEKLMAIVERLATQHAPIVNVNITLDGKKKSLPQRVTTDNPANPGDIPDPGGMPRPFVS